MQKKILFRTNLLICIILVIGFVLVSVSSYCSNTGVFKKDIEHVSMLTSESIYYQIDSFFSKPVNISLTMANDSLLKRFLSEESNHLQDRKYEEELQNYLLAYKQQYGYDSVFLISTATGRYYHFNGLNRLLKPDNQENVWYYQFLAGKDEYSLNVDNDEAAHDVITVFVNCKINDDNGKTIGVVGVGLQIKNLQQLLESYEKQYGIEAVLIDENGIIEISSKETGDQRSNLFDAPRFAKVSPQILETSKNMRTFWNENGKNERFVAVQYVPSLKWHLIIENDMDHIYKQLERQFLLGLLITALLILSILYVVNHIIVKYNERFVKQSISQELEYQNLLREATEGLYENVFEIDITHERAGGENTARYFSSFGLPMDVPYREALKAIARHQIKEEFAEGYLTTFMPENVLEAYNNGISELYYDFMITNDDEHYRWMRIRARIFYWDSDQSVRMITYRQDVTAEKEHEVMMLKLAQSDPLTGLYNKKATKDQIEKILENTDSSHTHALLMIDIDYFKQINDTKGHAVGDVVLRELSVRIKMEFRESDICGRIGGDEFMVFLKDIPSKYWLALKVEHLSAYPHEDIAIEGGACNTSASIGIAVYPEAGSSFDALYRNADAALYQSKAQGRNRFTMYHPTAEK